ncbi:hypothetical protein RMATCC62417_16747 [Rhizopus microsporus]|nr:hypothetical protein RMATCC62417_16747 [Rhizopus microsporus]
MKRKKDDDPPPSKAKRIKRKASDDGFQETPLLRKDKKTRTTLKSSTEDISGSGPSNVAISEEISMPAVNNETNIQVALPVPAPSTSCTSVLIKTSKKYISKTVKTEALKKEKEKNITMKALPLQKTRRRLTVLLDLMRCP